jgi:predicted nucleotidyltransferase
MASKISFEISFSLDPVKLHAWLDRYQTDPEKVMGLFCLSVWLAPHIPDHALVGAYSRGLVAKTYRNAASAMPRAIIEIAFGDDGTSETWKGFMDRWVQSEEMLTADDLGMLRALDEKDRGPFMYWLLQERSLCKCACV